MIIRRSQERIEETTTAIANPDSPDIFLETDKEEAFLNEALKFNRMFGGPTGSTNISKKLTTFAGIKNIQKDSIYENIQDPIPRKKNRRPQAANPDERRLSQLSLGKELALSRFTNLKMQWTMQAQRD
jgi:hypothetical protein